MFTAEERDARIELAHIHEEVREETETIECRAVVPQRDLIGDAGLEILRGHMV